MHSFLFIFNNTIKSLSSGRSKRSLDLRKQEKYGSNKDFKPLQTRKYPRNLKFNRKRKYLRRLLNSHTQKRNDFLLNDGKFNYFNDDKLISGNVKTLYNS